MSAKPTQNLLILEDEALRDGLQFEYCLLCDLPALDPGI